MGLRSGRNISAGNAECRAHCFGKPGQCRSPDGPGSYPSRRCRCVRSVGTKQFSTWKRRTSLWSPPGTFDHHQGDHFIVTQSGHEGDRLPSSEAERRQSPGRHAGLRPFSLTMCPVLTAVLVDKHQPEQDQAYLARIQRRRARASICSLPFGCLPVKHFFERDVVSVEKTPGTSCGWF